MPYAIQNPKDGESTQNQSFRQINPEDTLAPHEVYISDENWHEGWVWDTTTLTLREPTDADRLRWAKRDKEQDIRNAAEAEVDNLTRRNEADVVVHKSSTGAAMSQAERDIRATMQANHVRVVSLVEQVRAATTAEELQAIRWSAPAPGQVQMFASVIQEVEEVMVGAKNKRKKRPAPPPTPPPTPDRLALLEERVADIEAELDARSRVFEA